MTSSTIVGAPPVLRPRHVAAATIGNALEFYDFLTYAFFSIQIGHAFFPAADAYASLMLSLATFGAGFVTRPIGALVIGAYSDRVGRRPAMMLCFVLIGASIVAMALIPPYAAIGVAAPVLAVVARMVQGFSLGGEVGSNSAYLLEAAPLRHRGLALSWQGASQGMALIAAGLVGTLLSSILPPAGLETYGWRIAFLLGAVAVPFGLWLRSAVPETLHAPDPALAEPPLAGATHAAATSAPPPPSPRLAQTRLGQARGAWRIIVLGLVVLAAGTIGSYTFTYIVTYAQATLHMSARSGFLAETAGNVVGIAAALAGGALSDRIGRWPVNVGGNLAFLLLTYPVFAWVVATRSEPVLIAGVAVLSAAATFNAGSFYASLAESLPKTIRGSAFGTVYAVSIAAFGGTTQLVVTWLIHVTGSPMAPAWYLIGATAIGQLAYLLIRESAPARLRPTPAPIAAAAAA